MFETDTFDQLRTSTEDFCRYSFLVTKFLVSIPSDPEILTSVETANKAALLASALLSDLNRMGNHALQLRVSTQLFRPLNSLAASFERHWITLLPYTKWPRGENWWTSNGTPIPESFLPDLRNTLTDELPVLLDAIQTAQNLVLASNNDGDDIFMPRTWKTSAFTASTLVSDQTRTISDYDNSPKDGMMETCAMLMRRIMMKFHAG
jgi:hypothetical protein